MKQEAEEKRPEIEERDMALLFLALDDHGRKEEQQRLRERYGVTEEQFAVVLVGKDGGEKLRRAEHVPLETIFALIDTMPMRRQEMMRRE